MKKMNKKIGILIGTGLILSMGTMMKVLIKNREKKLSDFEEDDFYFDFDTENAKDNVKKDIDRVSEAKALVKELKNCKEEIIALWEHIEALSNIKEEVDRG